MRRNRSSGRYHCPSFQFTHPGKGATASWSCSTLLAMFQFTHPGKGATKERLYLGVSEKFQFTHPGKGATAIISLSMMMVFCFNSRTLGRVRRKAAKFLGMASEFQFTHPGKGATSAILTTLNEGQVSIHAPWEGCDGIISTAKMRRTKFQFTHPGKGAT